MRSGACSRAGTSRRRRLALAETVHLVVKQQYLQADVTPQCVQKVIAPGAEAIAVTGHYPHRQLRPSDLQPGGDGWCTTAERVKPVNIQVIGEAARTADAGNEGNFLPWNTQAGQDL